MAIVDFVKYKEENTPHMTGEAKCLSCWHKWVAVAKVGTVWLECPQCQLQRGRFILHASKHCEHWECNCGNDLFHVTKNGIYCPNCGINVST